MEPNLKQLVEAYKKTLYIMVTKFINKPSVKLKYESFIEMLKTDQPSFRLNPKDIKTELEFLSKEWLTGGLHKEVDLTDRSALSYIKLLLNTRNVDAHDELTYDDLDFSCMTALRLAHLFKDSDAVIQFDDLLEQINVHVTSIESTTETLGEIDNEEELFEKLPEVKVTKGKHQNTLHFTDGTTSFAFGGSKLRLIYMYFKEIEKFVKFGEVPDSMESTYRGRKVLCLPSKESRIIMFGKAKASILLAAKEKIAEYLV